MHSYSPLYGVIELIYAFVLSAVFLMVERYYYRIKSSAGPRIPNLNIEDNQHYLEEHLKNDEHYTPEGWVQTNKIRKIMLIGIKVLFYAKILKFCQKKT
jgi:hypothetical protein